MLHFDNVTLNDSFSEYFGRIFFLSMMNYFTSFIKNISPFLYHGVLKYSLLNHLTHNEKL